MVDAFQTTSNQGLSLSLSCRFNSYPLIFAPLLRFSQAIRTFIITPFAFMAYPVF